MPLDLLAKDFAHFKKTGILELDLTALIDPKMLFDALDQARKNNSSGRDLWRDNQTLSTLLQKTLSPLVKELFPRSPLRLALDQWISPNTTYLTTLEDSFAIQGITLGIFFLPSSLIIIDQATSIPVKELFEKSEKGFYLAAFASLNAVYRNHSQDPSCHALKKLHYQFGDRLNNRYHPLI